MKRRWMPIVVMTMLMMSITTPAWPDDSLESLLQRLPPLPTRQEPVVFPRIPQPEDMTPCEPGFVISMQGGCEQAPPEPEPCASDMHRTEAGICEHDLPLGAEMEEEEPVEHHHEAEAPTPGKPAESLICGPGLHFDELSGRCRRDVPLDPNNRPHYDKDTVTTTDSREISRREASEIMERHLEELQKIPGAGEIRLDREGRGIAIEIQNPAEVKSWPKEVDGMPIIPVPYEGGGGTQASHTINVHPHFYLRSGIGNGCTFYFARLADRAGTLKGATVVFASLPPPESNVTERTTVLREAFPVSTWDAA